MTSTATLRLKNAYAAAARGAGDVLSRVGILNDTPPPRDRRARHWAYSLTCAYDSLAIAELDVPWWTYRAIDFVDDWISACSRPISAFEWGSGASTLWLARRVDEVYSVEHDRGFADRIGPRLALQPNIHYRVVEPVVSDKPAVPSAKGGNQGLDFARYVAAIEDMPGPFAIIVIDGRAREACLHAAIPHLLPGGLIVFDNTQRRRYRRAIAAEPVTERPLRGLTPTLPYPDQTSTITVDPAVGAKAMVASR